MASTSQENNNDTQQQNHDVNVVNNKIESSVKKVIKPVSTLGKINPGVLKNLKDAMKCAVAKSKGVGDKKVTPKAKPLLTGRPQPILVERPQKQKIEVLSVENPHLNVQNMFPNLFPGMHENVIMTTKSELPSVQTVQLDYGQLVVHHKIGSIIESTGNSDVSNTVPQETKKLSVSSENVVKPSIVVRRGASDAVKLALAKKLENKMANKKIIAEALKSKATRKPLPTLTPIRSIDPANPTDTPAEVPEIPEKVIPSPQLVKKHEMKPNTTVPPSQSPVQSDPVATISSPPPPPQFIKYTLPAVSYGKIKKQLPQMKNPIHQYPEVQIVKYVNTPNGKVAIAYDSPQKMSSNQGIMQNSVISKIDLNSIPVVFDDEIKKTEGQELPELIVIPPPEHIPTPTLSTLGQQQKCTVVQKAAVNVVSKNVDVKNIRVNSPVPYISSEVTLERRENKSMIQKRVDYQKASTSSGTQRSISEGVNVSSDENFEENLNAPVKLNDFKDDDDSDHGSIKSIPINLYTIKSRSNKSSPFLSIFTVKDRPGMSTSKEDLSNVPTARVRVPFEVEGDRTRRVVLTKISTTDPRLQKDVIKGCKTLIKKSKRPFVALNNDSDDELCGFSTSEIQASEMKLKAELEYLKRNSPTMNPVKVEQLNTFGMKLPVKPKMIVNSIPKKIIVQPKIIKDVKSMLKCDPVLEAQLKKAILSKKVGSSPRATTVVSHKISQSNKSPMIEPPINSFIMQEDYPRPVKMEEELTIISSVEDEQFLYQNKSPIPQQSNVKYDIQSSSSSENIVRNNSNQIKSLKNVGPECLTSSRKPKAISIERQSTSRSTRNKSQSIGQSDPEYEMQSPERKFDVNSFTLSFLENSTIKLRSSNSYSLERQSPIPISSFSLTNSRTMSTESKKSTRSRNNSYSQSDIDTQIKSADIKLPQNRRNSKADNKTNSRSRHNSQSFQENDQKLKSPVRTSEISPFLPVPDTTEISEPIQISNKNIPTSSIEAEKPKRGRPIKIQPKLKTPRFKKSENLKSKVDTDSSELIKQESSENPEESPHIEKHTGSDTIINKETVVEVQSIELRESITSNSIKTQEVTPVLKEDQILETKSEVLVGKNSIQVPIMAEFDIQSSSSIDTFQIPKEATDNSTPVEPFNESSSVEKGSRRGRSIKIQPKLKEPRFRKSVLSKMEEANLTKSMESSHSDLENIVKVNDVIENVIDIDHNSHEAFTMDALNPILNNSDQKIVPKNQNIEISAIKNISIGTSGFEIPASDIDLVQLESSSTMYNVDNKLEQDKEVEIIKQPLVEQSSEMSVPTSPTAHLVKSSLLDIREKLSLSLSNNSSSTIAPKTDISSILQYLNQDDLLNEFVEFAKAKARQSQSVSANVSTEKEIDVPKPQEIPQKSDVRNLDVVKPPEKNEQPQPKIDLALNQEVQIPSKKIIQPIISSDSDDSNGAGNDDPVILMDEEADCRDDKKDFPKSNFDKLVPEKHAISDHTNELLMQELEIPIVNNPVRDESPGLELNVEEIPILGDPISEALKSKEGADALEILEPRSRTRGGHFQRAKTIDTKILEKDDEPNPNDKKRKRFTSMCISKTATSVQFSHQPANKALTKEKTSNVVPETRLKGKRRTDVMADHKQMTIVMKEGIKRTVYQITEVEENSGSKVLPQNEPINQSHEEEEEVPKGFWKKHRGVMSTKRKSPVSVPGIAYQNISADESRIARKSMILDRKIDQIEAAEESTSIIEVKTDCLPAVQEVVVNDEKRSIRDVLEVESIVENRKSTKRSRPKRSAFDIQMESLNSMPQTNQEFPEQILDYGLVRRKAATKADQKLKSTSTNTPKNNSTKGRSTPTSELFKKDLSYSTKKIVDEPLFSSTPMQKSDQKSRGRKRKLSPIDSREIKETEASNLSNSAINEEAIISSDFVEKGSKDVLVEDIEKAKIDENPSKSKKKLHDKRSRREIDEPIKKHSKSTKRQKVMDEFFEEVPTTVSTGDQSNLTNENPAVEENISEKPVDVLANTSDPVQNDASSSDDEILLSSLVVRKRGRPPKNPVVTPSPKSDTTKKEKKLPTKSNKKHQSNTEYTCGKCNKYIERKQWIKHLIFHNGLAWRIELDKPIDLNDEKNKANIMIKFQKVHRITSLKCEKCSEHKKSALGLIAHEAKCGLAKDDLDKAKVACDNCGRLVMAYSMSAHLKAHCPVLKEREFQERIQLKKAKDDKEGSDVEDSAEFNDSGRVKRRAVKKAEKKLKGVISSEFNPDDFIVSKKPHKVNCRTTNKWREMLEKDSKIFCQHSSECTIVLNTIDEAMEHHFSCTFGSENICTMCNFKSTERNEVVEHVKTNHSNAFEKRAVFDDDGAESDDYKKSGTSDSDSDASEGEEESEVDTPPEEEFSDHEEGSWKQKKIKTNQLKLTARQNDVSTNPKLLMFRFMTYKQVANDLKSPIDPLLKFRLQNYSNEPLYPHLKVDTAVIVSSSQRFKYEPWLKISAPFIGKNRREYTEQVDVLRAKEYSWSKLSLYQANLMNGIPTIFCGGPVIAMKWIPFPDSYTGSQILAVSVKSDGLKSTKYAELVPEPSMIQLWAYNKLTNKTNRLEKPELLYSLAIENGPVWDMNFCPSGGYSHDHDRLGLLACTNSSGNINIYSLPIKIDQKDNDPLLIKLNPCMILTSGITSSKIFGCKISWVRTKGHTLLAASFTNGQVTLWKIDKLSPLLVKKRESCLKILPLMTIIAHQDPITVLEMHSTEHSQYLLTGSHDRRIKVFRLNNDMSYDEIYNFKCASRVVCGEWPTNLFSFVYGIDSDYIHNRAEMRLKNPSELGPLAELSLFYSVQSSIMDLTFNEWTDVITFATAVGDIHSYYRTNYYLTTGSEKTGEKYINSFTDVIPIDMDPQKESSTETSLEQEHGLVFCELDHAPRFCLQSNRKANSYRKEDITQPPIAEINKISSNPNRTSYNYYAIGYESGFVRIKKTMDA